MSGEEAGLADLGLSLDEAKQLTAALQAQIVPAQVAVAGERRRWCAACGRGLASKGHHTIADVAAVTSFVPRWIEQLLARYNAHGPEALGDLRRRNGSAPSVLRPELLARLPERLATPPSDGGLWLSRKVAAWMASELGLAAVLRAPARTETLRVVAASAYVHGRWVADVAIDEASAWAKRPDHVVWIGLLEPTLDMLRQVQVQFELHPLAIEDAGKAHQRPKLDQYGTGVFIVARTAQLVNGRIAFGETHLFAGQGYVVSVRHGASVSYAPVRQRCEACPTALSHGEDYIPTHPRLHHRQLHAGAGDDLGSHSIRFRRPCLSMDGELLSSVLCSRAYPAPAIGAARR